MAQTVTQTLLIQAAPYLVVSLAGIAAALHFWRRCPVASALALAALATRLVVSAGGIAFSRYTFIQIERGADPGTLGYYSGLFNSVTSFAGAAALAMLVVAVFVGRSQLPQRSSAA